MADPHCPRAMILGHSFVRRLDDYIRRSRPSRTIKRSFNVEEKCQVSILGIGGRTVEKIIQNDLGQIRTISPRIIVLEIGSNDLCDTKDTVASIVNRIVDFVYRLHQDFSVEMVMLCQVIPRRSEPFNGYNQAVLDFNKGITDALSAVTFAKTWRHRGLYCPPSNIYTRDGIHLNENGNKALYRSYRGAILYALPCLLVRYFGVLCSDNYKHLY